MDLPFEAEETLASKVLVVDDEAVVRDVLVRLLAREADVAVTQAEDAEGGLALLRAERFDVLITDKNLPGVGGVELIHQARQIRPLLEAMIVTGYPSAESIIAAMAAGASDYLVKPFDDLRAVRAKVRAALERRAERVQGREAARQVATRAQELLVAGREVPEPVWRALEDSFARYERVVREGGKGQVWVVGAEGPAARLVQAGIPARAVRPDAPELASADVVVLPMRGPWRAVAERLQPQRPDVVLLGSPDAALDDLLEAITLRLELVDAAGDGAGQLPDRVRACLDRRSVQEAQAEVAAALERFQAALADAG
jgi:CheY-like chemotaxis protein